MKSHKSERPHPSPDLAQRVRSLMAQSDSERRGFLPPEPAEEAGGGSFNHLDIPYIDEDEDLTSF